MSVSISPFPRLRAQREKCVHFRFRLRDGYDFQAVAWNASTSGAAFDTHYRECLSTASRGYFESAEGMFEIYDLKFSQADNRPNCVIIEYSSRPLPPQPVTDQEIRFVRQKKKALQERHKQLQSMNDAGTKSVIGLYTLMLLYAAAPFTSVHGTLGFFRVWGLGGIWLAVTAWFYCDRAFWKYGNHLFEQVFCMRQLFQMDKIVMGRSMQHNLYAILPSYGYSWDRAPSKTTPYGDPTHLSNARISGAAWFFKIVSFFPLMYFWLFLSMLFFPEQMTHASEKSELGIYLRVAMGFSFVLFLWLERSMRSCDELERKAFGARRIGVESPWPLFPKVGEEEQRAEKARNQNYSRAAYFVSCVNLLLFVTWFVGPSRYLDRYLPVTLNVAVVTYGYLFWVIAGVATVGLFVTWGRFMHKWISSTLKATSDVWPSSTEVRRRVDQYWVPPTFQPPRKSQI